MNRTVLAFFLLIPAVGLPEKPKQPDPADYPITVQVISSRLVDICAPGCQWVPHLIVAIDGKKYELSDTITRKDLFRPGVYKARVDKEETARSYEYLRSYDLLLPDGWPRTYLVVAELE